MTNPADASNMKSRDAKNAAVSTRKGKWLVNSRSMATCDGGGLYPTSWKTWIGILKCVTSDRNDIHRASVNRARTTCMNPSSDDMDTFSLVERSRTRAGGTNVGSFSLYARRVAA